MNNPSNPQVYVCEDCNRTYGDSWDHETCLCGSELTGVRQRIHISASQQVGNKFSSKKPTKRSVPKENSRKWMAGTL